MTLGERLEALRTAAGLSKEGLAARATLSPALVGMIERGARGENGRLALETAAKLARALGCTIELLESGTNADVRAAVKRARAAADVGRTGTEG